MAARTLPFYGNGCFAEPRGGRSSRVRVGESESAELEASSGSALPLLFTVAIDDVLDIQLSPGTHIHLYVDDAVMVRHLRGPGDQGEWEARSGKASVETQK